MRVFLRQSAVGREPLAVAMSGVRMGERLLQIGLNDPLVAGALAAKPGLSGDSAFVVADDDTAVRVRRAAADASTHVDVRVHPLERLPFEDGSFDVAVIHNRNGLLTGPGSATTARTLGECRRVLRSGGRIVLLERGTPSGLAALFRTRGARGGTPEESMKELERAGFRSVRMLGDRDDYRFIEAVKAEDRA